MAVDLELEAFFEWLALHRADECVGLPGRCFDSPLARWLSSCLGVIIGVDGDCYGRPAVEVCCWRRLPSWACVFALLCEKLFGTALSADEAVNLLIQVEMLFSPLPALVA